MYRHPQFWGFLVVLIGRHISHRFGRNVLFRELALRVEGGTSVAVTGPNGSGKSTLLLILAGLLTPQRGEITLEARDRLISAEDRPLHCGMVAPYFNVYDGLSAQENLSFVASARSLSDAASVIDNVLDACGLEARADQPVGTFSSGMKQRVKLALAVMFKPAVLILDEPSTNLDEAGRTLVMRLQAAQVEEGRIVVVATNDDAEASLCTQRIDVTHFR